MCRLCIFSKCFTGFLRVFCIHSPVQRHVLYALKTCVAISKLCECVHDCALKWVDTLSPPCVVNPLRPRLWPCVGKVVQNMDSWAWMHIFCDICRYVYMFCHDITSMLLTVLIHSSLKYAIYCITYTNQPQNEYYLPKHGLHNASEGELWYLAPRQSFESCKFWSGVSKDLTCLSSTSHRCLIRFRSGEFGCQVHTWISLSCTSNHS